MYIIKFHAFLLFFLLILPLLELISYETVVKELQANTISHSSCLGIRGGGRFMPGQYPDSLLISIKVECTCTYTCTGIVLCCLFILVNVHVFVLLIVGNLFYKCTFFPAKNSKYLARKLK